MVYDNQLSYITSHIFNSTLGYTLLYDSFFFICLHHFAFFFSMLLQLWTYNNISISSVVSFLFFQRIIMFKVMNAVRLDTGEERKHEKGGFVISDSVLAIQCQQYTHITSTPLSTMSLRHQSGDWEGERERRREGDQSVKSGWGRKTEGKDRRQNTCFCGNVWYHYSRILPATSCRTTECTSVFLHAYKLF